MGKMKIRKSKLESFLFLKDSLGWDGALPLWSLQHYKKGTEDSYLIDPSIVVQPKKWPKWLKVLSDLYERKEKEIGNPDDEFEIVLDGVVTHHREGPHKMVDDLKIDSLIVESIEVIK